MLQKVKPAFQLKDTNLFRQQCYIDGAWVDADDKATLPVYNPADGQQIGTVPRDGQGGDAAGDRGRQRGAARVARENRQGALDHPAQVVRPHDGEPGGPRGPDDRGAGQAPRRIARRDRLRRVLHRVVRRRGEARLRRHHPGAGAGPPHRRHQAADRRVRGGDAVEFPERDDHAQGRPGARRGLHHGDQARVDDAVFGARAVRARGARRHPERRDLGRHRLGRPRSAKSSRPTRSSASSRSPARPRSASS